jgi:DNA-directed RNA polymerase subunit omega
MMEPSLDSLVEKVDSKYTLVVAAAKRARDIQAGAEAQVPSASNKAVTVALEELDQGLLFYERTRAGVK